MTDSPQDAICKMPLKNVEHLRDTLNDLWFHLYGVDKTMTQEQINEKVKTTPKSVLIENIEGCLKHCENSLKGFSHA